MFNHDMFDINRYLKLTMYYQHISRNQCILIRIIRLISCHSNNSPRNMSEIYETNTVAGRVTNTVARRVAGRVANTVAGRATQFSVCRIR